MKKRILLFVSAFIIVFALLPATVYASDEWRMLAAPIVERAQTLARIASTLQPAPPQVPEQPEQPDQPEVDPAEAEALAAALAAAAAEAAASASPWAIPYVTEAISVGIVPPALQNNYTQTITRAEFAAIAVAMHENLRGEITGRVTFTDTEDVNVQKIAYLGIMTGTDGLFNPHGIPNREQLAVMFSRLANSVGRPLPATPPTFADIILISDWAHEAVGQVQAPGIMGSTGDNNFTPQGTITREQAIISALRMHRLLR